MAAHHDLGGGGGGGYIYMPADADAPSYYYVSRANATSRMLRRGPVTQGQLLSLHRTGAIGDSNIVWAPGMVQWLPFDEVFPARHSSASCVALRKVSCTLLGTLLDEDVLLVLLVPTAVLLGLYSHRHAHAETGASAARRQ